MSFLRNLKIRLKSYCSSSPRDRSTAKDRLEEAVVAPTGSELFDNPLALAINEARMSHLASLGLLLADKTVLDVGCGVGHLAQFFLKQKCRVVCVDGREENIATLRERYPDLEAHAISSIEDTSLTQFGQFDIVFAYGLLYHLENPLIAMRNMAEVCKSWLLIETIVCDHHLPILRMVNEPNVDNQALNKVAFRPSPSFVVGALLHFGFPFVYRPRRPPNHPDFVFFQHNNLDVARSDHNLRCIFLGSRSKLISPELVQA